MRGRVCVCVCVCVCVVGDDDVCRMLSSLNVQVSTAARCSSLVDVMIDQDDFLIETLLRLNTVHAACHVRRSVADHLSTNDDTSPCVYVHSER